MQVALTTACCLLIKHGACTAECSRVPQLC